MDGVAGTYLNNQQAAQRSERRVVVCGFAQENCSFNPVLSTCADFIITRGDDFFKKPPGFGYCAGAFEVFSEHGITVIPTYDASAGSGGLLRQSDFESMAGDLLSSVQKACARHKIDGVLFNLHGAFGATEEPDCEGRLLEDMRKCVGPSIPVVITLDLHGIVTERMCRNINGLATLHTYPHIDMQDTGRRAAQRLLQLIDDPSLQPTLVRIKIPALVRGNELITHPHPRVGFIAGLMSEIVALEKEENVFSADLMWGNPFTDLPELCDQVLVAAASRAAVEHAKQHSVSIAERFWHARGLMQAHLVPVADAVQTAAGLVGNGTVILSDAADATSSGASGNGNTILGELVLQQYPGNVLLPIIDPLAVQKAFAAGQASELEISLGGSLDARYTPLSVKAKVERLSDGVAIEQRWCWGSPGPCAVLSVPISKEGVATVDVLTRPVVLMTDDVYLGLGQDPKSFDAVVIKTPHAQPEMFDNWCRININVDAPGATTANVKELGHKLARWKGRELYPMDEHNDYIPEPELYNLARKSETGVRQSRKRTATEITIEDTDPSI